MQAQVSKAAGETNRLILLVQCPDRKGIVAGVSSYLTIQDCSITESHQFNDTVSGLFFMRVAFTPGPSTPAIEHLRAGFTPIASQFSMTWELHDMSKRPRVVIAVSKFGHCLFDLLARHASGEWAADIALAQAIDTLSGSAGSGGTGPSPS